MPKVFVYLIFCESEELINFFSNVSILCVAGIASDRFLGSMNDKRRKLECQFFETKFWLAAVCVLSPLCMFFCRNFIQTPPPPPTSPLPTLTHYQILIEVAFQLGNITSLLVGVSLFTQKILNNRMKKWSFIKNWQGNLKKKSCRG